MMLGMGGGGGGGGVVSEFYLALQIVKNLQLIFYFLYKYI